MYNYPTKQSKMQSSPQSTPWCGLKVDTCASYASEPSTGKEFASDSAPRGELHKSEAYSSPEAKWR